MYRINRGIEKNIKAKTYWWTIPLKPHDEMLESMIILGFINGLGIASR